MLRIARLLIQLSSLIYCAAIHAETTGIEIYENRLDTILSEYKSLPQPKNIKRLVELDNELKSLVFVMHEWHRDDYSAAAKSWHKGFEEIGLYIGHYSQAFGYSNKLLVEAHRVNPNSPHRKFTLFSTILGEGTSHGLGEMPDISMAHQYLKEFPYGPYAEDTYEILGYFYDDLYKALLHRLKKKKGERDFKDDCFAPFITKEPYATQLSKARALGIRYLNEAISMGPTNRQNAYRYEALMHIQTIPATPDYGWHWCAD